MYPGTFAEPIVAKKKKIQEQEEKKILEFILGK